MTLSFRAMAGVTLALASIPAMARFDVHMGTPGQPGRIGTPGFTHAPQAPVPPAHIGTPGFPHAQPPVYVTPPPYPVPRHPPYVDPRSVYIQPPPVYVQPPPVYLQPYPGAPYPRQHYGNRFDRDRNGMPDYRERDTDRDGVPNFRDRRPFDRSLY